MRNLRQGQRQHPGMQGQLWRDTTASSSSTLPELTESNFLWPLPQPKIIFFLSFFLPAPHSLRRICFTLPPLLYGLKGEKRTNPVSPTTLRIQSKSCRSMLAAICRSLICSELDHLLWLLFLDNDHGLQ